MNDLKNQATTPPLNIPYGYCHCGCGKRTNIRQRSNAALGYTRGDPCPCLPGHGRTPWKDISGQRFHRLRALSLAGTNKQRSFLWNVVCDCGAHLIVRGTALRDGSTKSCGCWKNEVSAERFRRVKYIRHGMSRTPIYRVWVSMVERCRTPTHQAYGNYGGRGITVCERWLKFENFFADMGLPPKGLTLDRTNNDGNYEPGNCRWATRKQQTDNRRPNRPRKPKTAA